MTTTLKARAATAMAVVLSAATIVNASTAAAQYAPPPPDGYQGQPYQGDPNQPPPPPGQYAPDQGQYQGGSNQGQYQGGPPQGSAPPPGQYAPPPPGAEQSGAAYDAQAQQYDYDYGRRYSDWAAQYCVKKRNDAAAGAVIGGVLGAVIGGGLAGRYDRGAGIVAGGALGATTGALIGSSSSAPGGCPPGFVLRNGAPAFAYPAPAGDVFWAPSWYNPWVFVGGAWVYHPYRYWYFNHGGAYWRPGWRAGAYRYRYRRW